MLRERARMQRRYEAVLRARDVYAASARGARRYDAAFARIYAAAFYALRCDAESRRRRRHTHALRVCRPVAALPLLSLMLFKYFLFILRHTLVADVARMR